MSSQPPIQAPGPRLVQTPGPDCRRLAEQLHTLSEVVETITYRLLDLEERLVALGGRLQALEEEGSPAATNTSAADAEAQARLQDTETRLIRIESMLLGDSDSVSASHLSVVAAPRAAKIESSPVDGGPAGVRDIDGPFPEEPEQAFLDELESGAASAEEDGDGPPGFLTA